MGQNGSMHKQEPKDESVSVQLLQLVESQRQNLEAMMRSIKQLLVEDRDE
ncbi:hypothetical protein Hanom_Chr11g00986121 [Helianthus anomalus]